MNLIFIIDSFQTFTILIEQEYFYIYLLINWLILPLQNVILFIYLFFLIYFSTLIKELKIFNNDSKVMFLTQISALLLKNCIYFVSDSYLYYYDLSCSIHKRYQLIHNYYDDFYCKYYAKIYFSFYILIF